MFTQIFKQNVIKNRTLFSQSLPMRGLKLHEY